MKSGLKHSLKRTIIGISNGLNISSRYFGAPKGWIGAKDWIAKHADMPGAAFTEVFPGREQSHGLPVTLDDTVHQIFSNNANWQQPAAFVASIPKGRAWGRNGAVITCDDLLIGDVSREFGKYGGVFNEEHSIFQQVKLVGIRKVNGTVAVVAAPGSTNYHHWLYDTLPRIGLLKSAGLFDKVDYFVIDYRELPFQKESLRAVGIDPARVIACNDHWKFHIEADLLIVPSLPAQLGTICEWTTQFLRSTFLKNDNTAPGTNYNIYLSRKKAPTRKLINEGAFFEEVLKPLNFIEFFAEDHSISETARYFANAQHVVGVHGSGFANLVFCSSQTKVIDIVAPRHIDAYYWLLTDYTASKYGYIFGAGNRAHEQEDLVQNKVDHDIELDISQFKALMQLMQIH